MTSNIWEEPHHAAPGAEYGHLETAQPEDMTTLADDSRLNFERGIANWRQVRVLTQTASPTATQITHAAYLSLIDAALIWSVEAPSTSVYGNLIHGSGNATYHATALGLVELKTQALSVYFGERTSAERIIAAAETTGDYAHQLFHSSDGGTNWVGGLILPFKVTHSPIMPGGEPDKVIFWGAANEIYAYDGTSSPTVNVSGNQIQAGDHNRNGIVLLAGATNGKGSSDYGVSWEDWVTPYPSGSGIGNQDLVALAFDPKRTEFVMVRRAQLNGVHRLFMSTSVNANNWSSWRMLPAHISTPADWIELRCTSSGIWLLFYLQASPLVTEMFLSVAYSIDQGLTWRSERLMTVPEGSSQSRLCPALVPANSSHGSYVILANQWSTLTKYEVLVGGPFEQALASQSTIVT